MSFEEAWAAARDVEGWLTEAQGRRLFAAAGAVPPDGRIVEIGSFRGRSSIPLARGARDGVELSCIDPHAGSDRGPQEIAARPDLGEEDARTFAANLERGGVADRVRHVRAFSTDALGSVAGPIDLLFVDGAHRFAAARADLVQWGARVAPGGRMLVHDAFASLGVTLALLTTTVPARRWRYVGREGSLAEYVADGAGRGDAARQLAQLPWLVRNLVVKTPQLLGLRPGPPPY